MRVLLVANTLPPTDISGVGEQVLQLAAGLRERGHEVEVLGRGSDGARGPKGLFPLMVIGPLVRRLGRFRPHVVQVHESDGALAALACRIVGAMQSPVPSLIALLQVSYVEELRVVRPLRAGGRVIGRPGSVERRFRWLKAPLQIVLGCLTAWLADRVLAPSARTAGEIRRDYQVRSVEVLYNVTGGLERKAADEGPVETGEYLLFIGRLRIRKGVEVLLEALTDQRLAGARLLIAGDGEHRPALVATADALELGERVVFLGRRTANEVAALLGGTAALVVPSTYEGMPLVILEAMEVGVPVVASAVSGIPEVVLDGETGWLVPPEDPGRLADALADVLARPREAQRRGAAGRRRVETHFRPANAAVTWEELILGAPRVQEIDRTPGAGGSEPA